MRACVRACARACVRVCVCVYVLTDIEKRVNIYIYIGYFENVLL